MIAHYIALMREDIIRASKLKCSGVYCLFDMSLVASALQNSRNLGPIQLLDSCLVYIGKTKNGLGRPVSHLTAATKPPTSSESSAVTKVRKLLSKGTNIGVVLVPLCNPDATDGVESQLLNDFLNLENQNSGHLHTHFPPDKIRFLTSLCTTFICIKLRFKELDYLQKPNFPIV